jgi:CRP-like cAMP-binding protein
MRRNNADQLEYAFRDVPYRLIKVLSQLADKHGETSKEGTKIKVKLGPKALAGMVGSNAERVSRLLNKFQTEGLVRTGEGDFIVIPDTRAMKRALELAVDWS